MSRDMTGCLVSQVLCQYRTNKRDLMVIHHFNQQPLVRNRRMMLDPNVTPREDVEITRCNEIRDLFPRQYQQV